jgi:hypothetical protein
MQDQAEKDIVLPSTALSAENPRDILLITAGSNTIMLPICFNVMKPSPTPLVRYFSAVCNLKRIDFNPCQHFCKMEQANLRKKLHSTHGE